MSSRNCLIAAAFVVGFQISTLPALGGTLGNSFKGVELGMSLDRFMQTEFPDRRRPPAGKTEIPRSYRTKCDQDNGTLRRCWFEAWGQPAAPVCNKDMDGIIAHLRMTHRATSQEGPFTEAGANQWANERCHRRIDVGYGGSAPSFGSNVTYLFFNNRLMMIQIEISPDEVDQLIPKLIEAYGKPTATSEPLVQNAFGASFKNQIVGWANDEILVIVKRYDGRADRGFFSYTHKATSAQFNAQKAEANSSAAKDF